MYISWWKSNFQIKNLFFKCPVCLLIYTELSQILSNQIPWVSPRFQLKNINFLEFPWVPIFFRSLPQRFLQYSDQKIHAFFQHFPEFPWIWSFFQVFPGCDNPGCDNPDINVCKCLWIMFKMTRSWLGGLSVYVSASVFHFSQLIIIIITFEWRLPTFDKGVPGRGNCSPQRHHDIWCLQGAQNMVSNGPKFQK